jgi:hypothetical protein
MKMHKQSLQDFVSDKGQSLAASLLGLTQPGIRKALGADRQIYVTQLPDGSFDATEVRPFPSTKKDEESAA